MADKIGIIGFGNMGEAIASGLRRNETASGDSIALGVIDAAGEKAALAGSKYNALIFETYEELFDFSDITVIAIKPQDIKSLFTEIGNSAKGRKIVSIAAGTRIETIESGTGSHEVARFMPNLAAKFGKAVIGVSFGDKASAELREAALFIAGAIGKPIEIPEKLQPAFTGLSGSGIAYVFAFLHAMALGGTSSGFPYAASLDIALGTLEGAVETLRESKVHPIDMLSRVCSPGGTTIQGIKALEEEGFTASVIHAVEQAARKAESLER